ncbi:MAG TPA: HD domain-containing phosphohydrolase [Nitrospiraceae bacterium]|nr:HD domain-containing phosphohydrolase [Nitrospiraceae bacterium]
MPFNQDPSQTDKPTILVVDDEAGPRDALKVILRPFFNVQSADCARDALRLLQEHHIDLITLDQKLPDRQGLDLLQDIKQLYRDIEVIIITGYGSLKSAMDGIRHGAAGYLLKPFNVTELITLINQTLDKKKRLDFLRAFLAGSQALWQSEDQAAQAWVRLRENYQALTKHKTERRIESGDYADLVPLLSSLLEAKDRNLLNHSSRVSFYATLLGNRLSLTPAEQKSLALGSFLHDLGMIGMEAAQASEQTTAQAERLGRHTEIGARMVLSLGIPAEVGQIISYHHERYDGKGFPHGLQGEGIPLLARIVGIAEEFDRVTSDGPGAAPLSIDDAIRYVVHQAHTHFDPRLATMFAQVVSECKTSLPALALANVPISAPDP